MALNLSTLTSPANSSVLEEVNTTADFLESVPVFRNLARGSNKGGDAKQDVALNQPKALPLDANGKGYLYLSGIAGNYASVPDADDLDGLGDFVIEVKDVHLSDWGNSGAETFVSKWVGTSSERMFIFRRNGTNINFPAIYGGVLNDAYFAHGLTGPAKVDIKITRSGTSLSAQIDTGSGYASIGSTLTVPSAALSTSGTQLEIGAYWNGSSSRLLGKISHARMWNNATSSGTPVLDVDFTATNVRHGDTKFKCATGQVVTINQSGNDPATIIKKPVLRFDGANSSLQGLFANNIDSGYMFAAFSVLGDGGETYGRIFSVHNSASAFDYTNFGFIFSIRYQTTNDLSSYYNSDFNFKPDLFDADNGDILHEVRSKSGQHLASVNGDSPVTNSRDTSSVDSNTFNISRSSDGGGQVAIDLEYLALFPATITDAQADAVRNYINNRNNVFDLKDGFGYYFYDAQKAPVGAISSGSSAWNGRIVGSDNGDTDKLATQATANDQCVGDGFKVTFADNSDHLDIPSTTQAGWQVVGTSLGTFAYRVDNDARTELNILGNRGHPNFRKTGDLYGIMLLPESATSADVNAARKLLIDRGAPDEATASSLNTYWYDRTDIVEFDSTNMVNATNLSYAWYGCVSLSGLAAIQAPNGNNFTSAWQNCSSLQQFPAGAKLGTEATNVNFTSAFESSGLTSLPTGLDLSQGSRFDRAFLNSDLASIGSGVKFGTASSNVNFTNAFRDCSSLVTLPTDLTFPTGSDFQSAFFACTSLVTFPAGVFDTMGTPLDYCFLNTWDGCTALSATSVFNILSSIDTSGQSGPTATTTQANITIDYNTATGSLSAATNTAVTSLKAKGWSIVVNGVTL